MPDQNIFNPCNAGLSTPLSFSEHAVIFGAPGSGKTELALSVALESAEITLILTSTRQAAARLKNRYLNKKQGTVSTTIAQTVTAFAFEILKNDAAERGAAYPTLLTAAAQDELIKNTAIALNLTKLESLLSTPKFYSELRELWRIIDAQSLTQAEIELVALAQNNSIYSEIWREAAQLITACKKALQSTTKLSSSEVLMRAAALLKDGYRAALPKIVLIDDAADYAADAEQFIIALGQRGITVWLLADPDTASKTYLEGSLNLLAKPELLYAPEIRKEKRLQQVTLERVFRHGDSVREICKKISSSVGVKSYAAHREAAATSRDSEVSAYLCESRAQRASAIAYQLRKAKIMTKSEQQIAWSEMAVICRTREEALSVSRELEAREVPTTLLGGGVILNSYAVVRDLLVILEHILADKNFSGKTITALLTGSLFGLNKIKIGHLKSQLLLAYNEAARVPSDDNEKSKSDDTDRIDEIKYFSAQHILEEIFSGSLPLLEIKTYEHRVLSGFYALVSKLVKARNSDSPTSLLWILWSGLGIANTLKKQALGRQPQVAKYANQQLDAVMQLFYILNRNEEQDEPLSPLELISQILTSSTPQDNLAATAARDAVVVTTANSAAGMEFKIVCVAQLQQGMWPNLKKRGSILGLSELQHALVGDEHIPNDRASIAHDELRLLLLACSRAVSELHVFAIKNDVEHPSMFWKYFADSVIDSNTGVSELISGISLRDIVADLRYLLEINPKNKIAAAQLARLARAGVAGANPQEWYGVLEPTENKPEDQIRVSPSTLDAVSDCPLQMMINRLQGLSADTTSANIGSIVHHAFAKYADKPNVITADYTKEIYDNLWRIKFELPGEHLRAQKKIKEMAENMSKYEHESAAMGWHHAASEVSFQSVFDDAVLAGRIDRIEFSQRQDNQRLRIVDLKTGKYPLDKSKVKANMQLLSYRVALENGDVEGFEGDSEAQVTEAALVYVGAERLKKASQEKENTESKSEHEQLASAVSAAAEILKGSVVGSHNLGECAKNDFGSEGLSSCDFQLVPPVSWQE